MQPSALTLVGVSKRYGRRQPFVLRRIDAELEPGTIVHLQGSNGSGKSTLLRVIAGVSAATRGTITGRPRAWGSSPSGSRRRCASPRGPTFTTWRRSDEPIRRRGSHSSAG